MLFFRPARHIRVRMYENLDPQSTQYRITEIEVWKAEDSQQPLGASAGIDDLFTTGSIVLGLNRLDNTIEVVVLLL